MEAFCCRWGGGLYLARDTTKLINKYSGKRKSLFINNIVICELFWVLLRGYGYSKFEIIDLLKEMLSTIEFAFDGHNLLLNSVIQYEECEVDFADILIGEMNSKIGCNLTYTFDRKASKIETFEMM